MNASEDGGFLSRWARRKAQARRGSASNDGRTDADKADAVGGGQRPVPLPVATVEAPAVDAQPAETSADMAALPGKVPVAPDVAGRSAPPAALPTLEDVAKLTRDSDYSRFVQPGVPGEVRNAALKRLFTDPHFNVMDGLDTYIDDYGKPDPIPMAMLRQLNQSRLLGLFDAEENKDGACARASSNGGAVAPVAESMPTDGRAPSGVASLAPPDDDPDLRLQQDDGAERAGPAPGAGA